MPLRLRPALFFLLAGATLLAGPGPVDDSAKLSAAKAPTPYVGKAIDTERGGAAYLEEHRERFTKGRPTGLFTLYKGPGGKVIAERDLDFTRFAGKPDYVFRDLRNGYEEGATVEGDKIKVFLRDSLRAPRREKLLVVPEPIVVNGGLGEFVRLNWKKLESGVTLPFNMVIPARLDYYRFVAYLDGERILPPGEAGGRESKAVVIEPKNTVLRMLLPTIVANYDVSTLRMVRYQGIANVADKKGRSLRVLVDYPGMGP